MAERQTSKIERKRDRQSISVPFLWEERPGTPKRDWKPTRRPIKPAEVPVKLVVSVPFGWEEKPGTPLQLLLPPPVASYNSERDGSGFKGIDDQHDSDPMDVLSDSEVETYSFDTDESFSSAPSLLANCLIPTVELTHAVPAEKTPLPREFINNGQLQSPGSPVSDTESTASSYETGSTSLVGAPFLEWLFPLLVLGSNPGNKVNTPENDHHLHDADARCTELIRERDGSQIRRPLLTLGEMIVMSRRRSCQRKVMNMRKQTYMDFMKRNSFGCGVFGGGSGIGIGVLQKKWKKNLQLKLM